MIYETITSMVPSHAERALLLQAVTDLQTSYERDPELTAKLCGGTQLENGQSPAELAAWTVLTSIVYNLDVTKTRQ